MSDEVLTASPDADMFRALARSSPWRWRTLHFRHREGVSGREVEAWLRRPDDLLVVTSDGRRHRLTERRPRPRPAETDPVLRADGLVARRPRGWEYEHDDPMWNNYTWVAMLDPVELSHHVDVRNLRSDEVLGRAVWRADLRPLPGYDPRCGSNCCELLWSEVSWYADFGGIDDPDPDAPPIPADVDFPDHYDVSMDVGTGVVVRLRPVGGGRPDLAFEVDVLEVDADLDEVFLPPTS